MVDGTQQYILPNDREKVEEKLQIVEWKIAISQNSRGRKNYCDAGEKKRFIKIEQLQI